MTSYQRSAKEIVEKYDLIADVFPRYADLVSEVGELGKEMLKASGYGASEFIANDELALEFGDVMFSLAALANILNVDMDKAFAAAICKYQKRFEATGQIGSQEG